MAYVEFSIGLRRISEAGLLKLAAITNGCTDARRDDDFPSAPEAGALNDADRAAARILGEFLTLSGSLEGGSQAS